MKRKKIIRAGRLTVATVYTAPNNLHESRNNKIRQAKQKASTAAQKAMNTKSSRRKLEYLLAANFTSRDYVITSTYDDQHLPASKSAANRRMRRFFESLRKKHTVKYIYITEGLHGSEDHEMDKRLHHHIVLNGTGDMAIDLKDIAAAWPWGHVHIEKVEPMDMEALAQYLIKEPREKGAKPGARMWHQSIGLKRWEESSGWCADNETLVPPPGAIVLSNEGEKIVDIYGSYKYLKYYEPQYHHNPRYMRSRKSRIADFY